MQRITDVVGKNVVAAEGGEQIGRVGDVLLDRESQHLVGLVVSGGMLTSEQVVPFAEVATFGQDTVLIKGTAGVVNRKQWHEQAVATTRTSAIKDKPVITTAGRALGRVADIHIDESSGRVDAIEVKGRDFAGLVERRSAVSSDTVTIGPDAVVVTEGAVPADERSRG